MNNSQEAVNGKNKFYFFMSFVIKIAAITASLYGMDLGNSGLHSLTYFTNLSNICIDTILAVFLILDVLELVCKGKSCKDNELYAVKYSLTVSMAITFLVYLCILAPTSGKGVLNSYFSDGAKSFCVHFVTPILSIIDFFVFDKEYRDNKNHSICAVFPPAIYFIFVTILGYNGYRWGNGMYAPYNFINFGAKSGWFGFDLSLFGENSLGIGVFYVFVLLLVIFLFLGRFFLFARHAFEKEKLTIL